MALINFSNVTKYYVNDLILDHVSFQINKNDRVALIGNNGVGKTTLFKLILKIEEPTLVQKEDKVGDISILNGISIGYLNQNAIENIENTVFEALLSVFKKTIDIEKDLEKISEKINVCHDEDTLNKYDKLLKEYQENRGYTYLNEIDEMIYRFGFDKEIKDKQIKFLSGGERMKVAFMKILLFKYDLLLLDEPTNHLDISTIEWLENFLKTYNGTIFFISHDRYFLESLATRVFELENHNIEIYNMDFNHYLIDKETRYNSIIKQAKKEEKEIEKLKRFIEFYKPKPRFVSRAKDREHKLARIEASRTIPPVKEDKKIKMKISGGNLKNKQLLEIENLVVGYDFPLTKEISFSVYGQDRIAILGDNGIGKTTLIKTILNLIPKISGSIKEYRSIHYGYIKQNDYVFENNQSALSYLRDRYPIKTERELRTILGRFQFKGEDVYKDVTKMSNGEKMRLILCSFSLSGYELLVLDEPTNHLDLITKECLIESLKNYEGAIIFVSHDRYFINELATHCLYLSKNHVIFESGDYNRIYNVISKLNEELKLLNIKDVETKDIVRKEKLSNNKINELKEEMSIIEARIEEIDSSLENDDFVNYKVIEELTDEKDELEYRYLEIVDILERDKKL